MNICIFECFIHYLTFYLAAHFNAIKGRATKSCSIGMSSNKIARDV